MQVHAEWLGVGGEHLWIGGGGWKWIGVYFGWVEVSGGEWEGLLVLEKSI